MLTPFIGNISPDQMLHWGPMGIFALLGFWLFWKSKPRKIDQPLEIVFDPTNPSKRFWSMESPRDENGKKLSGVVWEYRVEIWNRSAKTLRNVSVAIEHIGAQIPVRPMAAIFEKHQKLSCDIHPGCEELVPVLRWPIKPMAGMLAGSTALAYGPVKVTASADDVPFKIRVFKFDYQRMPMLFD